MPNRPYNEQSLELWLGAKGGLADVLEALTAALGIGRTVAEPVRTEVREISNGCGNSSRDWEKGSQLGGSCVRYSCS